MKRSSIFTNAALATAFAFVCCGFLLEPKARTYAFEVKLTSDTDARAQLFFDIGRGIREEDSLLRYVKAGIETTCHFDLPAGEYRSLRLDPLDRPGRAIISEPVLLSPADKTVRLFPLSEFSPNSQLTARSLPDGTAEIVARDVDPILELRLPAPLVLRTTPSDFVAVNAARLGLIFVGAFVILIITQALLSRFANALRRVWIWRSEQPRTSIALLALFSALLACHPLLLGRSLLSPNFHIALLYEDAPAVPNVKDSQVEDVQGSDIGAMFWAHMPYTVMTHDALKAGELPLWNRYGDMGVTLLGQGQAMVGDPFNLLVAATNGAAWAFDAKYVLLRALFACGLGLTVFALRRDWTAAALVTGAAPFVGFFIFRVNHPAIFSVCYAPWILFAWVGFIRAPNIRSASRGAILLFVACWVVANSGTVKEASMLFAALNAIGAAAFLFTSEAAGLKLRKTALLAITGAAFLLASMPLWLTFADALIRARTFSDVPTALRMPARLLLGLFEDTFYREVDSGRRILCPSMNLVLLLGVLWCVARARAQLADAFVRWLFLGGIVALVIAFDIGPAGWLLKVPGLRQVQHLHNTFSCVAIVILSTLAGCGFAAARSSLVLPARSLIVNLTVVFALPALLLFAYFGQVPSLWHVAGSLSSWFEKMPEHSFVYAMVGVMFPGFAILHLLARRALIAKTVTWPVGVLAGIVSLPALAPHALNLPLGFRDQYFLTPPARSDLHATSPSIDRLRGETAHEPFRIAGTGATFMPNFGALHGLETYYGPDALVNRQYYELIVASGIGFDGDWMWGIDAEKLGVQRPMLDLFNVKFCVSPSRQLPAGSGYVPLASLDLAIYASPTVWPRAFFVDGVVPYRAAPEVVALARANPGHPFAAMLESDLARTSTQFPRRTPTAPGTVQSATDYRLTPNSTAFTVHATGPGVIALHEAWLKGDFRVTLNGAPASYVRVNHAFKGVTVDAAGDYRVEFEYWPRNFTLSLVCSAFGFALLLALIVFATRKSVPADVSGATAA